MEEVNKQELSSTIYVIAISTNQDSCVNLLNSVFAGIQSTDSQEWTTKIGDVNVKAYIKYPNCDIHRRTPNFADIAIASVECGDKDESDVVNYLLSRKDARTRILFGTDSSRSVDEHAVVLNYEEAFAEVKKYTEELTESIKSNPLQEGEEEAARREFAQGNKDGAKLVKKWIKTVSGIKKLVTAFEKCITEFTIDEKSKSENKTKFNFSSVSGESNGVGLSVELSSGDEFNKQNPNLPLTVRDNMLTATVEFYAQNKEGAEEIIRAFEKAKEMAGQYGLLAELDKVGITVTFSHENTSVFVDFTIGGIFGEGLINRFRSLNLDRFNFSLRDTFKIMTNVNIKDLWDKPDIKKVIDDLSKLSISGEAQLLNIRGFLHLIREISKVIPTEKGKKAGHMISYGLLILSTFENLGIDIQFDSEELKKVGYEIVAKTFLNVEQEQLEGMVSSFDDSLADALIPLGAIIGPIQPMMEPFMEGLNNINFDKISAEIVVPAVRTELKANIFLPGFTDFLVKNVLKNEN